MNTHRVALVAGALVLLIIGAIFSVTLPGTRRVTVPSHAQSAVIIPAVITPAWIESYVDTTLAAQGVTVSTVCQESKPTPMGSMFDCLASDQPGHVADVVVTGSANTRVSVHVVRWSSAADHPYGHPRAGVRSAA